MGEISLADRELCDLFAAQAEILRQHLRRRSGKPVGDAEGMILGEVAIVEDQNEMALAGTEPLDGVAPAAWKIPDVAGAERIGR